MTGVARLELSWSRNVINRSKSALNYLPGLATHILSATQMLYVAQFLWWLISLRRRGKKGYNWMLSNAWVLISILVMSSQKIFTKAPTQFIYAQGEDACVERMDRYMLHVWIQTLPLLHAPRISLVCNYMPWISYSSPENVLTSRWVVVPRLFRNHRNSYNFLI